MDWARPTRKQAFRAQNLVKCFRPYFAIFFSRDPASTGLAERAAPRRLTDQHFEGLRQLLRRFGLDQQAGDAVIDQFGNAGHARGDAGEALALRLDEHVRQPVAVAVARHARGEREQVGSAVLGQQLDLRTRAAPLHAIGDAEPARRRSFGEAGRRKVQAKFGLDGNIARLARRFGLGGAE